MRMSRMLRTIQESRIFIMDNEVIGAWGKAQGRRSSSSLDKRPAHTDFPRRLSYSRFLCHVSRMLRTIQESRIFIMDNEVIGAWGKTSHCIRHV
jgi:hypothetical protein